MGVDVAAAYYYYYNINSISNEEKTFSLCFCNISSPVCAHTLMEIIF